MELTDLQTLDQWKAFEEEITDTFHLDANVFNTDGIRITDHKNWANELCPAIKATDRGQSFICAVAHMNIATLAKNRKLPVVEECDAGIMKMVIPIMVADEFVGAVGACGMVLEDGEVDPFLISKVTGIDYERAERLAETVQTIPAGRVEALKDFITGRIEKILGDRSGS